MAEIKVKQKSRTRNLFGIQYADVIQDNETTYEAGKKVDLPGAISIKLTDNFESENLYSDGGIEEPLGQFTGGDGELEINRLAPQERDALLNQIYLNGFLMKSSDDKPKYKALSFISELRNGKLEFTQLYSVIFNQGDEISYNTKAEKIETQTNTLKFKYFNRKKKDHYADSDRALFELVLDEEQLLTIHSDARMAIDNWMTTVQEPVITPGTIASGLTLVSAVGSIKGKTAITVTPAKTGSNTYRYKTGVTVAMPAVDTLLLTWEPWDGTTNIDAATGSDLVVAEVDVANNCKKAGKVVVTAKA